MTKKSDDDTTTTDDTPKRGQQTLPAEGMERPKVKALVAPSAEYLAARNKRQAASKVESAKKAALQDVMRKNVDKLPRDSEGKAYYAFDDEEGETQIVYLEEKFNVKVKKLTVDEDE